MRSKWAFRLVILGVFCAGLLAPAGCGWFQPCATADFEFTPASAEGGIPLRVDFRAIVDDGAVAYDWDFGDGAKSTEAAPSHVYYAEGTYGVLLTVHYEDGTAAVVQKPHCITVLEVMHDLVPDQLYWLDISAGKIHRAELGSTSETTVVTGISAGHGLAVGPDGLYWTDGKTVRAAGRGGTSPKTLYTSAGTATSLCVDTTQNYLFWTVLPPKYGNGGIMRLSLVAGATPLEWAWSWTSGTSVPQLLAIDAASFRLYYYAMFHVASGGGIVIPQSSAAPKDDPIPAYIGLSTTMKNSFYENIVAGNLGRAGGMAVDAGIAGGARYVYYTSPEWNRVERMNIETTQIAWLINDAPAAKGIALDTLNGYLYWSDYDGIHRMNLTTRERELLFPSVTADALAIG
ncbi:MAG: PKD domain-containing protein [Thermotogota bacterium]